MPRRYCQIGFMCSSSFAAAIAVSRHITFIFETQGFFVSLATYPDVKLYIICEIWWLDWFLNPLYLHHSPSSRFLSDLPQEYDYLTSDCPPQPVIPQQELSRASP
ncbi:hypothetical protein Tco_0799061 [Tanacetum coccineum]